MRERARERERERERKYKITNIIALEDVKLMLIFP